MFDTLFDPIIPHLRNAADVSGQYAERVIARLDQIAANTQDAGITELREYYRHTMTAGETNIDVAFVPGAEEWELEAVVFNLTAAGPIILRDGGRLLWAKTPAQPQDAYYGIGIIVQGRGGITLTSPGAAAGEIFCQFRRKQPPAGRHRFGGGQTGEPVVDRPRVQLEPGQHAPTWQNGKQLVRDSSDHFRDAG